MDRPPLPDRVAFATITAKREELNRHVPHLVEIIPVVDLTFLVDNDVPEDEEIAWAVCRLLMQCPGGPSGMRAEHLRQWLISATQDDPPDATNWLNVVAIMQAAFRDGKLAE